MQHSDSNERRGQGSRPPFRRRRNRHLGLAERELPRQLPKPKGELPGEFAASVFGLINPLLQHAVAEEGYLTPTPIQEKSIPHLLEGRDLLGCAQTGTGKTAAFLLPILHRLAANPITPARGRPRALILAPTRELAAQIADSVTTYGKFLGIPFAVVFGGVSQYPQVKALSRGAELVVATPGRLMDLMEQGHLTLEGIEEFVLDEADRMLDMGFLPDIKRILAKLPEQRHTQFFSATLSPDVLRLAMSMVKDPIHVTISPDQPTVDRINQKIFFVDKPDKDSLLINLLNTRPEMAKVIVFARTRHGADKIVRKLEAADIRADAIHSDKTQRARTNTLQAFRNGRVRVLVATDIASRGIDVDNITHVVNFDLPEETESYVHRIGRTARAGAEGAAYSFVSAEERGLLRAIERMIRKEIPVDTAHEFHSERAERAAGKGGAGNPPPPPWAKPGRGRTAQSRRPERRDRPPRFQGCAQPDFGRRPDDMSRDFARDDAPRPSPPRPPLPTGDAPRSDAARQPAPVPAPAPRREEPAPTTSHVNWYDKPFKKHQKRHEQEGGGSDNRSDDRRERPSRDSGARADDRPARPSRPRPGDGHKPRGGGFKGGGFKGGGFQGGRTSGGGGFQGGGGFKSGGGFKKGPKPSYRPSRPPRSRDR
ncbi:MAG TPA: DEAD/DEAH box helicase [Kiritimatiellia bacterium]|nr:DEAD/DEAH box helicase [Kiritimatiellia bacterium]HRR34458.1 DEAD/DEAH box helicase [Kiritimatiellia bacterium]HRU69894.1 DEAD/DEAH box helicase [Kiritimatiellia bacterium]